MVSPKCCSEGSHLGIGGKAYGNIRSNLLAYIVLHKVEDWLARAHFFTCGSTNLFYFDH